MTRSVSLLSIAQTETHLILLSILWGCSVALLSISPLAFLTDKTTIEMRSQSLALFRSGGDLGLLLGALVSGTIASSVNMSVAVLVNATLLIGATIYFWYNVWDIKEKYVTKK